MKTPVSIRVYEKIDGQHSNKFYTMIADTGPGQFEVNYGPHGGWTKTIVKEDIEWDKTIQDRIKHGYCLIMSDHIDLDTYIDLREKVEMLFKEVGDEWFNLPWLIEFKQAVFKWGYLTQDQMKRYNQLYMEYRKGNK